MSKIINIEDTDYKTLYELEKGSAFTIEGAGGDINDWTTGLNKMLKEKGIGEVKTFYTFSGKHMNEQYELEGSNKYPDNFTFLSFKLDGLDVGKLAIFKLEFGARWLDDIIDNNARRQGTLKR